MNQPKAIPDIQLLGDYCLVKKVTKTDELKQQHKGNIVIPDEVGQKERSAKGIVLAISENCKFVKPKNKIVFFMYAPVEVEINDDNFLILSEKDILAIIGTV